MLYKCHVLILAFLMREREMAFHWSYALEHQNDRTLSCIYFFTSHFGDYIVKERKHWIKITDLKVTIIIIIIVYMLLIRFIYFSTLVGIFPGCPDALTIVAASVCLEYVWQTCLKPGYKFADERTSDCENISKRNLHSYQYIKNINCEAL